MNNQLSMFSRPSPIKAAFFHLRPKEKRPAAMTLFSERHQLPIIDDPRDLESFKVVFFSLLSFRDFFRLPRLAKYKIPGQEWIAGGNAVSNPTAIKWIMDYVWIGDAHLSFEELLKGRRDHPSLYDCKNPDGARYNAEPPIHDSINVSSGSEFQMSSGCPRRCNFCAITWRRPYQEQDKSKVLEFIRNSKTKTVGLSSSSSNDVSYYREIQKELVKLGKTDRNISNAIYQIDDEWVKASKGEVLIGMEGMSEDMRYVVNKPITRDRFRRMLINTVGHRRKVRTVFQFNLPGEREEDLDELLEDVEWVREQKTHGFWALPFIPHHTNSHTPLQWARPYYNRDMLQRLIDFRNREKGSGERGGMTVLVPEPLRVRGWFKELLAEWVELTPEIVRAANKIDQWASEDECRQALLNVGVDLDHVFCSKDEDYKFPWDDIQVDKTRAAMWKQCKRTRARLAKMNRSEEGNNKEIIRAGAKIDQAMKAAAELNFEVE